MTTIRVLPAYTTHTSTHRAWSFQPDDLGSILAVEIFESTWSPDEDTHPSCRPRILAGVTTLTYVRPSSSNALVHRDGFGALTLLMPGSSCLTDTGTGRWVEEVPREPHVPCSGLRMHIHAVKRAFQAAPPRSAQTSPLIRTSGAAVRIILGSYDGVTSPLGDAGLLLDVQLDPGGELPLGDDPFGRRAVLLLEGSIRVGRDTDLTRLVPYHLGTLLRSDACTLVGGTEGARTLVIGGARTSGGKPVYDGQIAAATWEQVARIREQAGRGDLGLLNPSV